jgi:hypothetical protein
MLSQDCLKCLAMLICGLPGICNLNICIRVYMSEDVLGAFSWS